MQRKDLLPVPASCQAKADVGQKCMQHKCTCFYCTVYAWEATNKIVSQHMNTQILQANAPSLNMCLVVHV